MTQAVVFNPMVEGFIENPYPHYREVRDMDRCTITRSGSGSSRATST
jgi:hypothetical protein